MTQITHQIRGLFTDYFKKQGHVIVPASSLIPSNDPTLMFTNSGMVQFKNYLTGKTLAPYPTASTVQKSVRAGGKHNDLDNVGYTVRHHTFFEMLGNFSFGDYFKEKAIFYAWDFLTNELKLDKERLLVTVFHTDEEAVSYWKKIANLSDDRIIRIATKDNFWQMGDTGPCGPSSEIFYDHGEQYWGDKPGTKDEDGDRFIEIWNLVFDQFEDLPDGSRIESKLKCIDTGAGLERWSAILQNTNDNFQIDIFKKIITVTAELAGVKQDEKTKMSLRVIADHLRSSSFLLADGVTPSNEGRGYVLRRIMRRAMRHAYLLGTKEPLMYQLVPTLIETMGMAYAELEANKQLIIDNLKTEEERFRQTLDKGLKLLETETTGLSNGDILSGQTAFKLYDTYGFPLDLTQDALREKGISVDVAGFETAMAKQREEARKSWAGSGDSADEAIWFDVHQQTGSSEFLGYTNDTLTATVCALIKDGKTVDKAVKGDTVSIVLNQTPFYGEMGGQIGDTGTISTATMTVQVTDTVRKADNQLIVHKGQVINGEIAVYGEVTATVDIERRAKIKAHHSATHLLQSALQQVLGDSVHQKGSMVDDKRLRFDFTYNKALTVEELNRIEVLVNEMITANVAQKTQLLSLEEAKKTGAMALFDDKYKDIVRVVSFASKTKTYSCELCGGTHVAHTGDIGSFYILSETGIAAGIRRIEAVVQASAVRFVQDKNALISDISLLFKGIPVADIPAKIKELQADKKMLEKQIGELKKKVALGGTDTVATETINGITFVGKIVKDIPAKEIKSMVDAYKAQIKSGVVAILSENEGKVSIVIGVTADLTNKYDAVPLVKEAAVIVGGAGGGGRADIAQAGGNLPDKMEKALSTIKKHI